MPDASLRQLMLREYGAVVGGQDLRNVLGFKSTAAFGHAVRSGHLSLRFFKLPGRRGRYALVWEVADWLETAAQQGAGAFAAGKPQPGREGAKM